MSNFRHMAVGLWLGLVLAIWASVAQAADALVYKGPGACDEGCSEAAALVAQMAGLNPVFVGPAETDPNIFKNAAVWIQPGGHSRTVGRNMSDDLKDRIREFVHGGGAYVGFCAGGFYATARIGELKDAGLGLIAGRSKLYEKADADATVLPLIWDGKERQIYWEGGPAFYPPKDGDVEVTATYPDGTAAAVRDRYGKGRVYVTGAHPEAPQNWRDYYRLADSDGLDYDLAVDMIHWAIKSRHHHHGHKHHP
jgi:glutamine amidotransferase-like uncharacterized protein